jgi:isocitrate dehydrogenase (NAD+)
VATRITVIPGDGIGPDIVDATLRVLDALDCGLEYDVALAGVAALEQGLELIPDATLERIAANPATLKGPLTTPVGRGFSSVNVSLRQTFDLFANVRPATSFPGVRSRYENVDVVIVRENTEGLYSGVGQTLSDDGERAEVRSVITRRGSTRLLRFAFEMARRDRRRKVTVVHKANILKTTSGLFLEVAREVMKDFPDLAYDELIIDNCAMQLVLDPARFDVIVSTNLFGDILSDLCAGLVGGLGLAPAANVGAQRSIFEAVHGSAPDIAGRNLANPTALLLAAAMMLDALAMGEHAARLRAAVRRTLAAGVGLTPDLGGNGTTTGYTAALIANL